MTRRERNQSRKGTKRALTSSVLAIALCVVLLAGATFAWFTDTASTRISEIKSGTLKIELQKKTANAESADTWEKVKPEDSLSFTNVDGSADILWEPGAMFKLPVLRVVNKGNLALKYKVLFTMVDGDEDLANVLDVYVNGTADENKVCTLADILDKSAQDTNTSDGELHGTLRPENSKDAANNPLDVSQEYTVYLKMQETAGNEYQGKSIAGVTVTVLATQDTYESDSKDDQYDAQATYSAVVRSREEAKTAVESGEADIYIASDFTWNSKNDDSTTALIFYRNTDNVASEITLNGAGTVTTNYTNGDKGLYNIWACKGLTLTIAGGTYVANGGRGSDVNPLLYANYGATIIVTGGTFIANNTDRKFNVQDANPGTIILRGGTYNFDPSKTGVQTENSDIAFETKDAYNEETGFGIKIEDGYKVTQTTDGESVTWYTIVPET